LGAVICILCSCIVSLVLITSILTSANLVTGYNQRGLEKYVDYTITGWCCSTPNHSPPKKLGMELVKSADFEKIVKKVMETLRRLRS